MQVAQRMQTVSDSATLRLNAAAQALKAKGEDVVNFTAGEPDFNVPEESKAAMKKAVDENRSKYTPVPGLLELRERIAKKTNLQQPRLSAQAPWKATEVVVSNGGKQALFNVIFSLVNPGDEVLIPAPYWLSYPEMVRLAGGVPVAVDSCFEKNYKITVSDLESKVTSKTKMLILNSPSNPTGATYSRTEFEKIAHWLKTDPRAKEIIIVSDEIYDRILFTEEHFVSFLDVAPELRSRVVTVNGLSKSAAMTGWRIGWSVAETWITSAVSAFQGQTTSGINAPTQYAGITALDLPEEKFAQMVESFRSRAKLTLEILKKAEKLKVSPPAGAFYAFVDVSAYLKPGEDSVSIAEEILHQSKVAVVPGTPFGAPGAIRMSFALDTESLKKGCERLVQFFKNRG